ncbi:MAG: hypothetical protein AMXMBFR84_18650 [Candidatus Hydrogenedentota bacterium]
MKTEHTKGSSRRGFLKHAAAGVTAAALGPQVIVRAQENQGERGGMLGSGEYTYEWIDNWAKLPETKKFGNTHAVCEVADGRIFVHNQSEDSVAIFDPDGNFMSSWGPEYAGGAHGMQLSKEGNEEFLYLATTGLRTVVKTTLTGEKVFELRYPKESGVYETEEKYSPTNIAIAPNGDFYVADGYGQSYIHHYNAKGEYIRSWGGKGSEPGQMSCPHGIWIDTRGAEPEIVVADRSNIRLQYFSLDGKHLRFVNDGFLHPCHFDQRGTDLLVPDLHGRVTLIDKDNKVIVQLGENPGVNKVQGYPNLPHEQRMPGKFISPHGACFDKAGNIFVAEWIPDGRVTKLRKVS